MLDATPDNAETMLENPELTLVSAGPMLPVVSTRKKMSTGAVLCCVIVTVFAIVTDSPTFSVVENVDGEMESAYAAPGTATATAVASASLPMLLPTLIPSLLRQKRRYSNCCGGSN